MSIKSKNKKTQVTEHVFSALKRRDTPFLEAILATRKNQLDQNVLWEALCQEIEEGDDKTFKNLLDLPLPLYKALVPSERCLFHLLQDACLNGKTYLFSPVLAQHLIHRTQTSSFLWIEKECMQAVMTEALECGQKEVFYFMADVLNGKVPPKALDSQQAIQPLRKTPVVLSQPLSWSIVFGEEDVYQVCLELMREGKTPEPFSLVMAWEKSMDKKFIFKPQAYEMIVACLKKDFSGRGARNLVSKTSYEDILKIMSEVCPEKIEDICLSFVITKDYAIAEKIIPFCSNTKFLIKETLGFSFPMAKNHGATQLLSCMEKELISLNIEEMKELAPSKKARKI